MVTEMGTVTMADKTIIEMTRVTMIKAEMTTVDMIKGVNYRNDYNSHYPPGNRCGRGNQSKSHVPQGQAVNSFHINESKLDTSLSNMSSFVTKDGTEGKRIFLNPEQSSFYAY